jgi:hypothetical protein
MFAAGREYPGLGVCVVAGRAVVWSGGPVMQAGVAGAVVAVDPAGGALPRDPELAGDMRDRAAMAADALHEQASAMQGQSGVSVHGGRPFVARR